MLATPEVPYGVKVEKFAVALFKNFNVTGRCGVGMNVVDWMTPHRTTPCGATSVVSDRGYHP